MSRSITVNSGITEDDRQNLAIVSDATRLRDIREWHRRLVRAHRGGYRLMDASVETVIAHVAFLLRQIDGRA